MRILKTEVSSLHEDEPTAFNWKFTADDLATLPRRISQREQAAASQQATLPQAA